LLPGPPVVGNDLRKCPNRHDGADQAGDDGDHLAGRENNRDNGLSHGMSSNGSGGGMCGTP
jgi:hypothetical protein